MSDSKQIKTALISVFHKDGLDEIIKKLHADGVRFLSTGGTKSFIESLGFECDAVEDLTGYPSILGGRVKTLHPKVFGGILARRDNESDKAQSAEFEIPEIDLVIVDLYPFEATVASGAPLADIIEKIDTRLKQEHPNSGLFIIKDHQAHMANLSVYVSTAVNGVARIHSEILKNDLFKDWYRYYPERFQNKTNGITPRRWLGLCNPELCGLIESKVGTGFLTDLDKLEGLKNGLDEMTVKQFNAIKLEKKRQLCAVIEEHEGVKLDPSFVFDVQVKRLHEYKRQLMNALSIMDLYFGIKDGTISDFTPTAFIFGAKAAPGYVRAKAIIRYINRVAELVNNDPAVADKMKVVFVQNYNCSYAEHIIPAADISEQISPAGTEASGTGNMKLMLNGAVTLGTLDGANVEIAEQAGRENEYIFGATVEEINMVKPNYNARSFYEADPALRRAVDTLIDGTVPTDEEQHELYTSLLKGASWHKPDQYFLFYDFDSYKKARLQANRDYRDRLSFGRKCLENVASAGKFSSDRTIRQYADEIWHIKPVK